MIFSVIYRLLWSASFQVFFSTLALAAEFGTDVGSFYEPLIITVTGDITYGDFAHFKERVNGASHAIVVFDSPGGRLGPAIDIAQYIKSAGFYTYVKDESVCRSACSVMWLAGRRRFLEEKGVIGFHAPVDVDGNKASTAPEISHALFGWAFGTLGIPEEVIMRIYDNHLIDNTDYHVNSLSSIGIDFTAVSRNSLQTVLAMLTHELSSFERGLILVRLMEQALEPIHFPTVEIMNETEYAELVNSGSVLTLSKTTRLRQNANFGFLEDVNSLDLIVRNAANQYFSGMVFSCGLCKCDSPSHVVIQLSEIVSEKALYRTTFSAAATQMIKMEFGADRLDCLGVTAIIP